VNVNIDQLLGEARSLSKQGRELEARELLKELLLVDRENAAALMMMGGSFFCEELYPDAEEYFQRLVLLAPGSGKVSVALFNSIWKQGRHEEALEEIKRFTKVADKSKEQATLNEYMKIVRQLES
jgi:tetratricopeptide (TPR) repeat protein